MNEALQESSIFDLKDLYLYIIKFNSYMCYKYIRETIVLKTWKGDYF